MPRSPRAPRAHVAPADSLALGDLMTDSLPTLDIGEAGVDVHAGAGVPTAAEATAARGGPRRHAPLPMEDRARQDLADLALQFADVKAREHERRALATAASCYVTLVFTDPTDAAVLYEYLLAQDVTGDRHFVDGYQAAHALGLTLPRLTPLRQRPTVTVFDQFTRLAMAIPAPPDAVPCDAHGLPLRGDGTAYTEAPARVSDPEVTL